MRDIPVQHIKNRELTSDSSPAFTSVQLESPESISPSLSTPSVHVHSWS